MFKLYKSVYSNQWRYYDLNLISTMNRRAERPLSVFTDLAIHNQNYLTLQDNKCNTN